MSIQIQKRMEEEIQLILNTKNEIILFGAKLGGQLAYEGLRSLGKDAVCFLDNKAREKNSFLGKKVILPQEALKKYGKNAIVFICLLNPQNREQIKKQLALSGFTNLIPGDVLYYSYLRSLSARSFSKQDAAQLTERLFYSENQLVQHDLSFFITSKCVLKCRHCATLTPYLPVRQHQDAEKIIACIKMLEQSYYAWFNLVIVGGEPFLHPELLHIIEEAAKLKGIFLITIITNAALEPDISLMKRLRELGVQVRISDYGSLSKFSSQWKQCLRENNVIVNVQETSEPWYCIEPPQKNNLSKKEADLRYKFCFFRQGSTIVSEGRLHRCDFSASASAISKACANPADSIDIMNSPDLKKALMDFLEAEEPMQVCAYCSYSPEHMVKKAEQLPCQISDKESDKEWI